ncbi:DNA-binding protein YbaB [Catenuloplanes nepalensis]|uniref:DNA-binding protein YbaB n=1 Tax=Catenuloplanes nepalensis TaxID=587533 RepID=A0ABT9MJN5_9ACTN|nr:YbaB/EbfC family nucleoid-associated protein [Catenuloplanes nepalensis]MDP9791632.1 DNA-binding protein YbaB [Catenuloplanes nepalensis]
MTFAFGDGDLTDPDRWLREQEERTARLTAEAGRAQHELAATQVTATSRDQSVSVTVNPSGVLLGVRFSPRATELTAAQLSARVMEAYGAACAEASQRMLEIMSGLVGDDSSAMAFLKSTLPPVEEETR